MLPSPESGYTLIIGDMKPGPEPYLCLLHDESGMKGTLIVLPKQAESAASVPVVRPGR